jgi:hypothetical protein
MLGEISNSVFPSLGELKLSLQGPARQLPSLNSIVGVTILDKTDSVFKLLVDGSVFLANLPVSANIGESMLAKVLSQNPFVLSLDGFFPFNSIPESIVGTLALKLGIENSIIACKVIKALVTANKSVSKAKVEEILEHLKNSGSDIDENQLLYLINLSFGGTEIFRQFGDSSFEVFREEGRGTSEDILSSVSRINAEMPDSHLATLINEAFVININSGKFSAGKMKRAPSDILQIIGEISRSCAPGTDNSQMFLKLKKELTAYIMQMAWQLKSKCREDFIIVENNGLFSLVRYNIRQSAPNEMNVGYKIHLEFTPEYMGIVKTDLFYTNRSMQISFCSNLADKESLEKKSKELQKSVEKFLHFIPSLYFRENKKTDDAMSMPEKLKNIRGINVRL